MVKQPTEIRLDSQARILHVAFSDGTAYGLPVEYLRVESPSAEVQGHHPSQKQTVAGRRFVNIMRIEPVGHYAVRLVFDDLHDSGIYTWEYLAELGAEYNHRWTAYLHELAAAGLSRDP